MKYIDPSGESWDDNDSWPPDEDEYEDENKDKDIEWTWNEDEDVNIEWTWNGKEWIGEITEVEYIIYNSSQEESFEDSDDGFGGLDDRFENSNGFSGYDGFDEGPVRKREKYIRLKNQDNRFGEPGLVPLSEELFFFIVSEGAVAGISAAFKGIRWLAGRGSSSLVTKYPANAAVSGTTQRVFLRPGQVIDRYGSLGGKWFSKPGTSYGSRSIPSGQTPYTQFRVLKPFEVNRSLASPGAFGGQTGFGLQFQSPVGTDILIKRGIIAPFKHLTK